MGSRRLNDVFIAIVGLIASWEVFGRVLHVRHDVLPTPSRILLEASREYPLLVEHGFATIAALANGILAALGSAALIVACCALSGTSCRSVERITAAAQAVPFLASVPVLVVWFGYGSTPEALVVFLVAFPVILTGMFRGLRSIPREILDFGCAVRAAQVDMVLKVTLPSVIPPMLASLRAAVPMSVAAATAAEFVLAETGLGALMLGAASKMNTPLLLAAFFCVTALAAAWTGLVKLAECVLIPGALSRQKP